MRESNEISIVIIEDDFSFSLELKILIEELGYTVNATTDNSEEAIRLIQSLQPDIVLMDVGIKGTMSGIEVAAMFKEEGVAFLFITSYEEKEQYAQANQTNAIGYLVKPIQPFTLRSSIQLAIQNLARPTAPHTQNLTIDPFKNTLFFRKGNVFKKTTIPSICYIEADGNYRLIVTETNKVISAVALHEYEELLEEFGFMRIHRKYLVNLKKIQIINTNENYLTINNHKLPISRNNKSKLKELIKTFN